ncbi:MAG TPA: PAS domain-containing protein [Ktedonobacteraceae bacterium]
MTDQRELSRLTQSDYQLSLEAAGIGFWAWDLRQRTQTWSNQCKAIFGLQTEDEVSQQRFLALVHPADRESLWHGLQTSLARDKEYHIEFRIIYADQGVRWVHTAGQIIRDEQGQAVRLVGVVSDVTASKETELERNQLLAKEQAATKEAEAAHQQSDALIAELELKRAFFQAVVNQAPCGIFIAEAPGGKVIFANKESSKTLGHRLIQCNTVEEYAQYHAFHLDGRPYLAEEYPLARGLRGEVIMQEHSLYRQGNGKMIHLSSSAAPVRDPNGLILASATTFYNVSEHYELERKKDEFIGVASHELRTPLTSIKGNLQLMQRGMRRLLNGDPPLLTATSRSDIEHLIQWNERALRQANVEGRLINDLLDASRIQTEELRVYLEPGDLAQVVRDAVNDVQAVSENQSIFLSLPEQPIPVMLDRVRIGQVVTNYLTNALKHSLKPESIMAGITLSAQEARVWVQDAGPGLSLEEQQDIWERFSQVRSFVDYRHLGDGLGLDFYINHALIQLHGGRTGVESTAEKGSLFWFTLPLTSQDTAA